MGVGETGKGSLSNNLGIIETISKYGDERKKQLEVWEVVGSGELESGGRGVGMGLAFSL